VPKYNNNINNNNNNNNNINNNNNNNINNNNNNNNNNKMSSRPSYYDLKIFSMAVLTLKFDLDLSKVKQYLAFLMPNICAKFHEVFHLVFEKSQQA